MVVIVYRCAGNVGVLRTINLHARSQRPYSEEREKQTHASAVNQIIDSAVFRDSFFDHVLHTLEALHVHCDSMATIGRV